MLTTVTMVETGGEKKQGIGMNYKKQWGYHPLAITRPTRASRCTWSTAAATAPATNTLQFLLDLAIDLCRQAGFRRIIVRGDTNFALTERLEIQSRLA